MPKDDVEVAVIGGGAAGIAAARRLHDAGVDCLIVEARDRLGGRAWTVTEGGQALDLGCGWLHSADRNPWRTIAERRRRALDRSRPPWSKRALPYGFPYQQQQEFAHALDAFHERMHTLGEDDEDCPASAFLDPTSRWNGLINAVNTYVSGAELDQVSARDLVNYADTGINWRVVDGYGTLIAAHAAGVPVAFESEVRRIDHGGPRIRVETGRGAVTADRVIVTLPTDVIAARADLFAPLLPHKTEAASRLPLGLDDKLFVALDHAEEFEKDVRLFGHTDRSAAAAYQIRPFGRPQIEVYFGGTLARQLEREGEEAFFRFAVEELTFVLGSAFARRIKPIRMHLWAHDPFARGAYSYAKPGATAQRLDLALPVDDRLFFAGEACSPDSYSTAHGALMTGVAAADQILARMPRGSKSRRA